MDNSTQAYDEYIAKRCEEIAENDPEYKRLMNEHINKLNILKKALADFENSAAKMQAYGESLMLKSNAFTAQNTAQKVINHG